MIWSVICIDCEDDSEMHIEDFSDELSAHRFKKEVIFEDWVDEYHHFEVRATHPLRCPDCGCSHIWLSGSQEPRCIECLTKGGCPCGGIILADTEDLKTPICEECYEAKRATDATFEYQ